MARLPRYLRYSFSGGEVSPRFVGRSDLEKYFLSAETIENFTVHALGTADRRSGTTFVAKGKTDNKKIRLVPFRFSSAQAYILEFGDQYMRVYKNGGQVQAGGGGAFEIATPYTEAQLPDLQWTQSADILFIVHGSHAPRKLVRLADDNWTLSTITFRPEVVFEAGDKPDKTLTPSATTGVGINLTVSAAYWLSGDEGREVTTSTGARAVITSITSSTVAVADVLTDFPNTDPVAAGSWTVEGSPRSDLKISSGKTGAVGTLLTITARDPGTANSYNTWHDGTSSPVGKDIYLDTGIIRVTQRISATQVKGVVTKKINDIGTQVVAGNWSLEELAWTAANGFPQAITLHEGRAVYGGTTTFPNMLWGSRSGVLDDFGRGTGANDAFAFELNSPRVDSIQWIGSLKRMFLGTAGGEFSVNDGNDDPLTSTNIVVRSESAIGSPHIAPARAEDSLVFIDRGKHSLWTLGFNVNRDAFVATNLLLLADHITEVNANTLDAVAFQQTPTPTVWAVRGDGTLVAATYIPAQNVIAVTRQIIGGTTSGTLGKGVVESVAVIPHWTEQTDSVWIAVKRTIDGVTVRHIEYLNSARNTDSSLTYSGAPTSSVTGLSHLKGETVWVIGDQAVQAQRVVDAGGAVVVSPAASEVEVGLDYKSKLVTLPYQTISIETTTGLIKRISKTIISFYKTVDAVVNGTALSFGSIASPTTDEQVVEQLGYDDQGKVTIEQTRPLPMTIREIAVEINIDDDKR